jgi:hypothetical protein
MPTLEILKLSFEGCHHITKIHGKSHLPLLDDHFLTRSSFSQNIKERRRDRHQTLKYS